MRIVQPGESTTSVMNSVLNDLSNSRNVVVTYDEHAEISSVCKCIVELGELYKERRFNEDKLRRWLEGANELAQKYSTRQDQDWSKLSDPLRAVTLFMGQVRFICALEGDPVQNWKAYADEHTKAYIETTIPPAKAISRFISVNA
jgi:hypothetical protein